MQFKLVIKHYQSGTRRFFRQYSSGRIRRINGSTFDELAGSIACVSITVRDAA